MAPGDCSPSRRVVSKMRTCERPPRDAASGRLQASCSRRGRRAHIPMCPAGAHPWTLCSQSNYCWINIRQYGQCRNAAGQWVQPKQDGRVRPQPGRHGSAAIRSCAHIVGVVNPVGDVLGALPGLGGSHRNPHRRACMTGMCISTDLLLGWGEELAGLQALQPPMISVSKYVHASAPVGKAGAQAEKRRAAWQQRRRRHRRQRCTGCEDWQRLIRCIGSLSIA